MNGGEEAPANVSFVKHCMVCEQPFSARTRKAKSCGKRKCIAFMTNFHESSMFEFLMLNMRCRGGSGLES
jgi:hypothetical protein